MKRDLSWLWFALLVVLLALALAGCSHAPVTSGESLYEANDEEGCWCGAPQNCSIDATLWMCAAEEKGTVL